MLALRPSVRPTGHMSAACISWAGSSSRRFPLSPMERSKHSRPPSPAWWYETATLTWERNEIFAFAPAAVWSSPCTPRPKRLASHRGSSPRCLPCRRGRRSRTASAGTALKRASSVNVSGQLSLWAESSIVVRIRHHAFLSNFEWELGRPVRAGHGSRSVYMALASASARIRLTLADEDEHVSADRPLDDRRTLRGIAQSGATRPL